MYEQYEFVNLTQLGHIFGDTCFATGKWLVEIELRTSEKKPSQKAHTEGYCITADNGQGGYYYVWDREKTILALEKAGHRRKDKPLPIGSKLHGPFSLRESGNFYEIINGDGTIGAWIIRCPVVKQLIKIMNLAYRLGKLD